MQELSISARGLSKRYVIGAESMGARSFRETLMGALGAPLRRLRHLRGTVRDDKLFWALKDVSFDVHRGSVLGIIGPNGAGKSTLLKILSRITGPTEGEFTYAGRLASLLEVGTGFHGELSGRENIFLNGAILGMQRREILERFDAIVEFADVSRFIDTPVKRYSSGMYVRLAFAVAVHMDPDILVVDEVLSVGDAAFHKKCLGKMSEISRSGRTVLFVSHNLDTIQRLCREALYLKGGRLEFQGSAAQAVERYLSGGRALSGATDLSAVAERWGSGRLRITGLSVERDDGGDAAMLAAGEAYRFVIHYHAAPDTQAVKDMMMTIELTDARGVVVWLVSSVFANEPLREGAGSGAVECRVQDFNLAPGEYAVTLYAACDGEMLDSLDHVLTVTVSGGDYFGSGHPGLPEHCRTLTRSTWRNV